MLTDLSEVVQDALDARLSGAHVALPGKVLSYDATAQTADVEVGVNRLVPTSVEGEFRSEKIPPVYAVPVCWPRGNGQHFAPGLAVGDGVLLVICDLDPSTWVRTGNRSDPADLRKMDLSHAVCVPGFAPAGSALPPSAKDLKCADAEIGGSTDAAALASMLDKLIYIIGTTWTPVANDGGAALKIAVSTAFPSLFGSAAPVVVTSTGSAVLKLGS